MYCTSARGTGLCLGSCLYDARRGWPPEGGFPLEEGSPLEEGVPGGFPKVLGGPGGGEVRSGGNEI